MDVAWTLLVSMETKTWNPQLPFSLWWDSLKCNMKRIWWNQNYGCIFVNNICFKFFMFIWQKTAIGTFECWSDNHPSLLLHLFFKVLMASSSGIYLGTRRNNIKNLIFSFISIYKEVKSDLHCFSVLHCNSTFTYMIYHKSWGQFLWHKLINSCGMCQYSTACWSQSVITSPFPEIWPYNKGRCGLNVLEGKISTWQ